VTIGERVLGPDDSAWARSYPVIRDPRPGESLAGFMLGLDDRNGFAAGQTYRLIRRFTCGPSNFGPGYFITGTCLDLRQLGDLAGGVGLESMLALTARSLADWLFSDRTGASTTYAPAPGWKICTECMSEGYLPLLFLFDQISVCAKHRRTLVASCDCSAKIGLFHHQEPGRCHLYPCTIWYRDIPSTLIDPASTPQPFRYWEVYADLLAFAATQPAPLVTSDLVLGLRTLIARGRVHSDRLAARMNKKMVSLRTIADILVRFSATAADLNAACHLPPARPASAPVRSREGVCPNPVCAGRSKVLKDGHVVHTRERQFVCKACGTRFCRSGVLFAFVPLAGYPRWRAVLNAEKFDRFRKAISAICARNQQPLIRLSAERVFADAGVPSSPPYQSEYAGLLDLVATSNRNAGALSSW
jgi:hypothetical protein